MALKATFQVKGDGEDAPWVDGYGAAYVSELPPFTVSAERGRGGEVRLYCETGEQANAAFHLLCRCYTSVETDSSVDSYFPKTALNLGPHEFGSAVLDALPCCAPGCIALGPSVVATRAANLEAMRKARLPKAPRVPRNSPNTGQIMPRLRARILERDNFRCKRCGNDATSTALEVDHIIPRAKGGTNDERNLQTLCWACNRGKSDSDPLPHELEGVA